MRPSLWDEASLHCTVKWTVFMHVQQAQALFPLECCCGIKSCSCHSLEICYMPGTTNALQEWFNLFMSLLFIYGNSLLIVTLLVSWKHKKYSQTHKTNWFKSSTWNSECLPEISCSKWSSQGCPNISLMERWEGDVQNEAGVMCLVFLLWLFYWWHLLLKKQSLSGQLIFSTFAFPVLLW